MIYKGLYFQIVLLYLRFRLMCEGGIYVFITHFMEYVVGVGIVERLNHSVLMLA